MEKNENKKKEFVKPIIIKEEGYQTSSDEHCHQVKECDPYPAKA